MSYSEYEVVGLFFFFNDTATTEIYTLSLHDALPICAANQDLRETKESLEFLAHKVPKVKEANRVPLVLLENQVKLVQRVIKEKDRKSTRLNSSHANISYAVFCLKKKKLLEKEKPRHATLSM